MSSWKDEVASALDAAPAPVAAPVAPRAAGPEGPSVALLEAAGRAFQARCHARYDEFASKSCDAAFDIAAKVKRFGSYASDAQAAYAWKLCTWARVREDQVEAPAPIAAPAPAPRPVEVITLDVPNLASRMGPGKFGRLIIDTLRFSLRNDPADVVFVKDDGDLVGVIDLAKQQFKCVKVAMSRGKDYRAALLARVAAIEVDPKRALEDHGLRTGSCGCCGRLLTDPTSISIGIGPICLEKFGGF